MLIGGIALGLILGLLAGGSLTNLASVRLRWVAILMFAVILRYGTEFLLVRGNGLVELIRLPLFLFAFVLLLAALWVNRTQPGMRLAFVGILSNTIAITANGGHMPIWIPSLEAAGFNLADLTSPFHVALGANLNADFVDIKWVIETGVAYGNPVAGGGTLSADHHSVTIDVDLSPFTSASGTPGAEHVKGTISCP